jgi:hypothetical protein
VLLVNQSIEKFSWNVRSVREVKPWILPTPKYVRKVAATDLSPNPTTVTAKNNVRITTTTDSTPILPTNEVEIYIKQENQAPYQPMTANSTLYCIAFLNTLHKCTLQHERTNKDIA